MNNRDDYNLVLVRMAPLLRKAIAEGFSKSTLFYLLEHLAIQLNADCFTLQFIAQAHQPLLCLQQSEDDFKRPHLERYLRGLYVLDPFYNALKYCAEIQVSCLSDVIDEPFEANEYYATYFNLSGSIDCCAFVSKLRPKATHYYLLVVVKTGANSPNGIGMQHFLLRP